MQKLELFEKKKVAPLRLRLRLRVGVRVRVRVRARLEADGEEVLVAGHALELDGPRHALERQLEQQGLVRVRVRVRVGLGLGLGLGLG